MTYKKHIYKILIVLLTHLITLTLGSSVSSLLFLFSFKLSGIDSAVSSVSLLSLVCA